MAIEAAAVLNPATLEFREGPIDGVVFRRLTRNADQRGWLIELYREDESPTHVPLMAYVSETAPGVSRGPHAHLAQTDYFAFVGPGDFRIQLWDIRPDSPTYLSTTSQIVGETNAQAVVVPPGVVHGYRNLSAYPAWVFNAPDKLYAGHGKRDVVDEIRYESMQGSPFHLD